MQGAEISMQSKVTLENLPELLSVQLRGGVTDLNAFEDSRVVWRNQNLIHIIRWKIHFGSQRHL